MIFYAGGYYFFAYFFASSKIESIYTFYIFFGIGWLTQACYKLVANYFNILTCK